MNFDFDGADEVNDADATQIHVPAVEQETYYTALDELDFCLKASFGEGVVDFETQLTNGNVGYETQLTNWNCEIVVKSIRWLLRGRLVGKAALAAADRVFTKHGLTLEDINSVGDFFVKCQSVRLHRVTHNIPCNKKRLDAFQPFKSFEPLDLKGLQPPSPSNSGARMPSKHQKPSSRRAYKVVRTTNPSNSST